MVLYGYKRKDFFIFTGKEASKLIKIFLRKERKEKLFGIPVYKGKVVGKVKIITSKKDFSKFKSGEILVSPHTTPDYLPVIKKAKAILTERGGITSHAVIVSRELKKSCIVGIKDLIVSLKDGDLVEVDADKGVVKRIV